MLTNSISTNKTNLTNKDTQVLYLEKSNKTRLLQQRSIENSRIEHCKWERIMEINYGNKFTQKDINIYIDRFFDISVSDKTDMVFNLEQLEWISSEEITFLFAWLKRLLQLSKKVIVRLPFSFKKFDDDDDEIVNRRRFLKYYLWEIWGLHKFIKENVIFENYDDINNLYNKYEKYNFGKKVLPFQTINTKLDKQEKVDEKFYTSDLLFNVDKGIEQILNENDCYSPFENRIISEIITKELFMNSAEHAETDECYFTAAFKGKWGNTNTVYFKDQFTSERDEDTLHFYKNKEIISKKIAKDLEDPNKVDKKIKTEKIIKEKGCFIASLQEHSENDDFKNQSFVEFTFIDFGKGIYSTLSDEYERNKEKCRDDLSHKDKNRDSAILEYAFLLDSSKEPFDRRIDNENADSSSYTNLIPRGLYFLIDMVRRYKGLLVARSGYGKVVYDFSNRIKIQKTLFPIKERIYVAKDAVVSCKSDSAFLQGTMISIILPERKNVQKTDVTIDNFKLNQYIFNKDNPDYYPPEVFKPEKYEYLSLSFLYNVLDTEDISIYNSKILKIKSIFKRINQKLIDLKGCNCVLFIDFEYLPTNENIFKILLYLSNSPLVNEFTKVVVLNLDEKEFSQLKAFEKGIFYCKEISFLYKPIPCIRLNKLQEQEFSSKDIQWIGIAEKEDIEVLSKLFFGRLKDNNIDISKLFDKSIGGNILPKSENRVYIFEDFKDLIRKAKEAKLNEIKNWILHEDNKVMVNGEKHDPKRLFLTSKGKYQKKYISFYEKISFKYTAQYFAQYLLDKYIDNLIDKYKTENILGTDDWEKTNQDEIKKLFRFDKILAVTVSSQLLAIEVRNIIRTDDRYSFLKTENEEPELIKLSSYFSFEDEKPLRSIEKNQEILIVNDVISTGSLIKRQMDKIDSIEGRTKGVLSIVDVRAENDSEFFGNNEQKIISVIASWKKEENNSDFIIERNEIKPDGKYEIKRINPILNSIITLNSKHAEKNKILFEKPQDLFETPDTAFNKDIFQIGHFKQSLLSCSSYYVDMKQMFSNNYGRNLLQSIRNQMKVKTGYECKPTFIFYPISSAIEEVNEDTYHEVFGTNKANIVGLSRYETPYGWRFVFPPKRYNNKVFNEPILIIDSGTLSGQSLLQLIDAVSIYEVQRIDVLIVIGRLDDFQREFYSRIKEINVKMFDYEGGNGDRKTNKPINIYFGTNLHIPSYQAEDMCPFCKETILLTENLNNYSESIPVEARSYIEKRIGTGKKIGEIQLQKNGQKTTPDYIPIDRMTKKPDFQNLFIMRDELGKIDGYRFYEDYFSNVNNDNDNKENERLDDLCNQYSTEKWENLFKHELGYKGDLRKFEQILICILHEPRLISTIKDLLSNLFDILKEIIDKLMLNDKLRDDLNYQWSKYSILRLYYTFIGEEKFYTPANFETVFNFCDNDTDALNYASFLLAREGYKLKLETSRQHHHISEILVRLDKVVSLEKNHYARGVVDKLRKNPNIIENVNTVIGAFETLYKFFVNLNSTRMHGEFSQKFSLVDMAKDNPIETEDRYRLYVDAIEYITKELKNNIYNSLKVIRDDTVLKQCFDGTEYDMLFHDKKDKLCVFNALKEVIEFYNNFEGTTERDDQKIKELSDKLYKFKLSYILDSNAKSFSKYCDNHIANVKDIYMEVKNEITFDDEKFCIKDMNLNREISLHKSFLYKLMKEILGNAINHANKQNEKVILDIYTKSNMDGCCYDLIFEQSTKFENTNNRQSGTKDIIEKLLQTFFLEKHSITYAPQYIIKINITNI